MVLACGKWTSAKSFKNLRVFDGGMAVRHLDVAPAFERREQHEQLGGAVALVFVIVPQRPPRFHRNRCAGLGNDLL